MMVMLEFVFLFFCNLVYVKKVSLWGLSALDFFVIAIVIIIIKKIVLLDGLGLKFLFFLFFCILLNHNG